MIWIGGRDWPAVGLILYNDCGEWEWKPAPEFDDNMNYVHNGKCFLYLYKQTGKEKYKQAVQLLRKQLENHPRTSEGGFWHKFALSWLG